ncbi:hypothetical protein BBJ28_00020436 [Nothophytophthora sp. Chile5]|nr:hypothetical protein BBJ28_00020436 [Nothophytophthora sp. Chile5]
MEYTHRKLKIGHPINVFHDGELANLVMATTHFVADKIAPQYCIGLAKANEYVCECGVEDSDVVVVQLGPIAMESEEESHAMSPASSVLREEEITAVKIESMSKRRMTNDEDEGHHEDGGLADKVNDVEEDGDDHELSPFKIQTTPKAKKTATR